VRRKLIVLNVTLVAAMAFAGVQLRKEWKSAKEREAAARKPRITPPAVAPLAPLPQERPVSPSQYVQVAQKDLFHPSRDPNVVVEPPPPPPAPPPPPPPPPLPVFHGTMVLGSGPIAILSVNSGAPHQATRVGERIGAFTLTDISADGVTLEWNGQQFVKKAEELSRRAQAEPPSAGPSDGGRTPNEPPVQAAPPEPVKPGPGEETPYGIRTCSMNDGTAEGTVMDGHRKVVYTSPFGKTCGWEKVK
jgi:hypothetical protein